MSDSSPPPRPKPGSLRDRIAAFEQKPASSTAPPLAPRPKPGNLSQWKPRTSDPPDPQPVNNRADPSMSASDAKESITKGGSLKERMAALQGLGAFGGGSPAAPPPKPSEKPKWKPPPQVAVAPPVTGDEDEDNDAGAADKPAISPLKAPSDDISAALSNPPPPPPGPVQEGHSEVEGEAPSGGEEVADPEEEERQRRAAIAARMARLGGTRVGMGPPIFARKPEVKPKPTVPTPAPAPETTQEEPATTDAPVAEPAPRSVQDVEHARAETEVAESAPLPTSPPSNEATTDTSTPQPQGTPSEYFPHQPPVSASPNIPARAMPIPQGPRRAAPPRKKSAQKQSPPAETEAAAPSLETDAPVHDSSDTIPESQSAPVPAQGNIESEVNSVDPGVDAPLSEPAEEKPEATDESPSVTVPPVPGPEAGTVPAPPPAPVSPSLDPHVESPDDEPEVDSRPTQDLRSLDDIAESAGPSIPTVPRIAPDETEVEVAAPEPGEDETPVAAAEEDDEDEDESARRQRIAERVAETGGFEAFGSQLLRSPSLGDEPPYVEHKASSGTISVEDEGTTLDNQTASTAGSTIPYSVVQQGGDATAANEEDDGNDESDARAQVLLQHALGDESLGVLGGPIDYDDALTRVPHEVEAEVFTHAADFGQDSEKYEGERDERVTDAPSPPSTIYGRHATDDDFGVAQTHAEGEPLVPALSADDTSDNEMAPPRVTRPLPPAPEPPAPAASPDLFAALGRVPPPPAIPRKGSLPPPTRTVPVPSPDSSPLVQGSSPQRAPTAKRTSLLPPSREIPSPTPDTPDLAPPRRQPSSTKRASLPPPTRAVPSPSVSREGTLVPPPPPSSFGYSEQEPGESGQTKEAPQLQDEIIVPPPPPLIPSRRPSVPPPTPDGRRSIESRRSTESRSGIQERRGSGQYAIPTTAAVAGSISTPPKKRVPQPLPLEQEVLDDDVADPIDPRFHALPRSPNPGTFPRSPPPTSDVDPLSSSHPSTPTALPSVDESEGHVEVTRRKTIAERMAKLGGIKFGAPPPVHRVQPSVPVQPAEDAGTEESIDPEQPAPGEQDEEEEEQARRQRIAARIAGMGGMRVGMLPTQPGMGVVPPRTPPPVPSRPDEEATPRSPPRAITPAQQPAAHYYESDQDYEHPSSSDDGVQVEAEESELEEVRHEDLEDEYEVEDVDEATLGSPPPPPPPPRSTRPPVPVARPPPPPPSLIPGRRPSAELPPIPGRSGSFDTITSIPRPPPRQPTSDFVMVEAEEAQPAPPPRPPRGPPPVPVPVWPSHPPLESSDLAGTGQWELPSIPSGGLDLGDSVADLSGSMWSDDSTAYPPASLSPPPPPPPPPTGAPLQPMGQPLRAPTAVPGRMTAEDLRALWERVGVHVAKAASALLERSKHTLVGNGSYEGFIAEALAQVPYASPPHGPGEYGILVYAQTAAQVHTRLTDIMPGDVAVIEGARLKGHKGLHTYSISAGEGAPCMGVVSEFDAKKLKLRVLQANRRVGQATVESVSYKLEDLKSGTIKVYRVREA